MSCRIVTKTNSKTHERITRINHGIESRLGQYTNKIEDERRRFLRNMIHAQVYLRSEYKRLKDERFRNMNEKSVFLTYDTENLLEIDDITTEGILHCPGVQGRKNRQKNLKPIRQGNTNDELDSTSEETSNLSRSKNKRLSFHPIPNPALPKLNDGLSEQTGKKTDLNGKSPDEQATINSKANPRVPSSLHIQSRSCSSKSARTENKSNINEKNQRISMVFPKTNPGKLFNEESDSEEHGPMEARKLKKTSSYRKGRRNTAPSLSRLSVMKKQLLEEEAEYVLRLRKQNQQVENENITRKVWAFIGKRPVSAFASGSMRFDLDDSGKRRKENSMIISEEENLEMLKKIQHMAKKS